MIEDSVPKKLTVVCVANNCKTKKFLINIEKQNSNISYVGFTNSDGIFESCIKANGEYKIQVCSDKTLSPVSATRWVLIGNCNNYVEFFLFQKPLYFIEPKAKKFFLTDSNYKNLPIEKGGIFLWQDHIV